MKAILIALAVLNLSASVSFAQGDMAPAGGSTEGQSTGGEIVRKKDPKSCPHCKDEHGTKNHKKHGHDKHPHDQHDAAEGAAH